VLNPAATKITAKLVKSIPSGWFGAKIKSNLALMSTFPA
jgi:hypothetical protein